MCTPTECFACVMCTHEECKNVSHVASGEFEQSLLLQEIPFCLLPLVDVDHLCRDFTA